MLEDITSPERGIEELKREVKEGRQHLSKSNMDNLRRTVARIKRLVKYLHGCDPIIKAQELPFDVKRTEDLLSLLSLIQVQIDTEYPKKTVMGRKFDGEFLKQKHMEQVWSLIELGVGIDYKAGEHMIGGTVYEAGAISDLVG